MKKNPSLFKTSLIAIRPFALPASTMPVVFGTVLATAISKETFNLPLFIIALFSMVILHSGANMLNDVNDFRKGLDRDPTPVSGAIVRGYISLRTGLTASIILMVTGIALGLVLVYYVGIQLLVIGVIGIAIGVFYTASPFALKYNALGDLAVFLDFGILGALGAWTVQTGKVSWVPAVWAIPMSMLVVAILHANNWRDLRNDAEKDITTFASLLGDRGSMVYYGFLIFGAFGVLVLLLVLTNFVDFLKPGMPLTFMIIFIAFPLTVKLIRRGKMRLDAEHGLDFITLDAETSKLNLIFGLLCTAALLLHMAVTRWF